MASKRNTPNAVPAGSRFDEIRKRAADAGKVVESGGTWWKWPDMHENDPGVPGSWVCVLVNKVFDKGRGKADPFMECADVEGAKLLIGLSGNLGNFVDGSSVGHVLTILWVGSQDIGKQDPMRTFEVVDHGRAAPGESHPWPDYAGEYNLPF